MSCPDPGSMNSCLPKCVCRGSTECPHAFYCDRPCGADKKFNPDTCQCENTLYGDVKVTYEFRTCIGPLTGCSVGESNPGRQNGGERTFSLQNARFLNIAADNTSYTVNYVCGSTQTSTPVFSASIYVSDSADGSSPYEYGQETGSGEQGGIYCIEIFRPSTCSGSATTNTQITKVEVMAAGTNTWTTVYEAPTTVDFDCPS